MKSIGDFLVQHATKAHESGFSAYRDDRLANLANVNARLSEATRMRFEKVIGMFNRSSGTMLDEIELSIGPLFKEAVLSDNAPEQFLIGSMACYECCMQTGVGKSAAEGFEFIDAENVYSGLVSSIEGYPQYDVSEIVMRYVLRPPTHFFDSLVGTSDKLYIRVGVVNAALTLAQAATRLGLDCHQIIC
ncbi:hypothetical protein KC878_03620 [Candidatus Saccharibacteria bacterium]|nr:hypothetical protein [Candidatus Saccharibacteria bacterium]